jgi:hypothetical protein
MACLRPLNPLDGGLCQSLVVIACLANKHSPVSLLSLKRRHTQKLTNGLLGVVDLHLLGIVVLVLDIDVAALVFVFILVLKVVAARTSTFRVIVV